MSLANLDELIHHLKYNVKTKLAVSSVNGIGVFAIRDIKMGRK